MARRVLAVCRHTDSHQFVVLAIRFGRRATVEPTEPVSKHRSEQRKHRVVDIETIVNQPSRQDSVQF